MESEPPARRIGGAHRALLAVGWGALWLGVLTQLAVSLAAAYVFHQGRCFAVAYTFAPLLVSCGERSALDVMTGWAGTVIVLLGPVVALVAAAGSVALVGRATQPLPVLRSAWLGGTAVLVPTIGWAVYRATVSSTQWGEGAWIFLAAATMLAALVVSRFVLAVVLALVAEPRAAVGEGARVR